VSRVFLPVAVLGTVVALLAGCGGGSEEDFQQDVVAARNRTDAALAQVTAAKSLDDFLKRLRIAATEVRAASADVRKADPPDDVVAQADELETSLHDLSDELVGLVDTFETAPEAIGSARGFNFETWDDVQASLTALRRAGIEVAPLQRHQAGQPGTG
jgi:hypothetical protein